MAIDLVHGYGMIPYGHGLYGYGMTVAGDNDADVTPLDIAVTGQSLEGSAIWPMLVAAWSGEVATP